MTEEKDKAGREMTDLERTLQARLDRTRANHKQAAARLRDAETKLAAAQDKPKPPAFERAWWQSKKFGAFLIVVATLVGIAVTLLVTQDAVGWPLASVLWTIVVTIGAVGFAYMGKQALIDKYLRGISMRQLMGGAS